MSRVHIADVAFNDTSVCMEINWGVDQLRVDLRNKFLLNSICPQIE